MPEPILSGAALEHRPQAAAEHHLRAAALGGDPAALGELVRLLTPLIQARVARALLKRAWSRSRAGDIRTELEDLTQEVFVRLFANDARALRTWDPTRGLSLANFVGLVAEREIANVFRSSRRTPWSERIELRDDLDGHDVGLVDRGGEGRQIDQDLARKLDARLRAWLSPRGRALFDVLYVQERPLAEASAQFGLLPGAIYAWRNRVGKKARELLCELQAEGAPKPTHGGREGASGKRPPAKALRASVCTSLRSRPVALVPRSV